ncbi:MAG: hypothetical protein HY457_01890 [Parcubacteria group bacterium]|nr:hypothetical protein [Parcubacteria group bacterium]
MRTLRAVALLPALAAALWTLASSAAPPRAPPSGSDVAVQETAAREYMREVSAIQFQGTPDMSWDQIGLIFSTREFGFNSTVTLEGVGNFFLTNLEMQAIPRIMDRTAEVVANALIVQRFDDVAHILREEMELERRALAQVMNAPIGTTWIQLNHRRISQSFGIEVAKVAVMTPVQLGELYLESERREIAAEFNLPPDAPWSEVFRCIWANNVIGVDHVDITWRDIHQIYLDFLKTLNP